MSAAALPEAGYRPSSRGGGRAGAWALAVLLLLGACAAPAARAGATGGRVAAWRVERDIRRFRFVATDRVMGLLAITPGMAVLDIGAGTGQFAYEFGRRLQGSGRVYATDTNPWCVDYMSREAGRRGLGNVHPVLVAKDGLDVFYGRQRYDLITIFHVLMPYEERIAYFRDLRRTLAEGGRLVLILERIAPPFSRDDFTGDFGELVDALFAEPDASPFRGILAGAVPARMRRNGDAASAEELADAVVAGFNRLLADPGLAARIVRNPGAGGEMRFSAEERPYAEWLLQPFRETGIRNRTVDARDVAGDAPVATINKLLIVQKFRKFLKADGLFASGFTPGVRAAFGKAGYRIAGEYPDLVPFEDVIVLVPR